MLAEVLFLSLAGLLLLGCPIAISLLVSSTLALVFLNGMPPMNFIARSIVTGADSFPLIAVPLYILAGDLMQAGGLSRRIIDFIYTLVSNIKGALAYVNVLACTFFAAISGSSPATVAAIGSNIIPEMEKRGYRKPFSAALTASAGMIGVMIPPSIPFIIYGVSAETSIGKLFLAGVVPGLMFAFAYCLLSRFLLRRETEVLAQVQPLDRRKILASLRDSIWALIIPFIILGGIYGGLFTPTEAGGVAVVYSLICALFIYKELSLRSLYEVFTKSFLTTGTILVLVIFASAFGKLLVMQQIPVKVAEAILDISNNKIIILLCINLALLLVGMFMETIASIIILTPIFLPVAKSLGIDPIMFGTIMTVNLAIGFCSPPVGVNLFVASQISGLSIEKVTRALVPFFILMLFLLLLVTFCEPISMFLPRLMD